MDNTARSQAGQPAFDSITKTQNISDQYNSPQQTANSDAFEDYLGTTSAASPQAQQQQRQLPQVPTPNQADQGPIAEIADEDDKDDRTQAVKQESVTTEIPMPVVQPSHPEVLIQKELHELVKPGPDANKKDLPEEPERLGDIVEENKPQEAKAQKTEEVLPMTYGEAMLAKKKERSIKKGISWVVREIVKQWKQRLSNPKEQDSKEQIIK